MMTKNSYIRRLLLMGALLVAVTASADSYFFIDDPQFKPTDIGKEITLPVKASFDKDVSSWDVQFVFPEGLIPVRVTNGSDLTIEYLDSRGRTYQQHYDAVHNSEMTHFTSCTQGWRGYDEDGENEYLLKWEAGIHNEMFLITFRVDYDFYGGDIQVYSQTSCGYDNDSSSGITPDPSVTSFVIESDINLDGSVSIADVTAMLCALATGEFETFYWPEEGEEYHIGDINHDGYINIIDLNELCDYLWLAQWYMGYELNEVNTVSPVTRIENYPTEVLFYIDPFEITANDLGKDITVPVKARFGGLTSSWDVQFVFPNGLTPVGYAPGADMKLTTMNHTGDLSTNTAWCEHNDEYTHFVAATMCPEYEPDGLDFVFCGTAKWIPGDYQEMFLLTIHVSEDFDCGGINIQSKSSCGMDYRDGAPTFWPVTINYNQYLPGDINGDGNITVADVTDLMLYLSGYTTDIYDTCADVHADSRIDLLDMEKLIDLIFHGTWYEGYVLNESIEYYADVFVNYPQVMPGDLNGDGTINISDVTALISLLMDNDEIDLPYADVNGDGVVNISDVTYIINMVLTSSN